MKADFSMSQMPTFGLVASTLLFAACSSGSDTSAPPPPPPAANTPPVFTSQAAASVAENSAGVIYVATISDPDNDPLQFGLVGTDGTFFSLTEDGQLSFRLPPDFERPLDDNSDNTYEITIGVSDGISDFVELDVSVMVTDINAPPAVRYVDVLFPDRFIFEEFDIPFASFSDTVSLTASVYTPLRDDEARRPLIIFAFPGGFFEGSKDDVRDLAVNFAQRGYVAAAIDYRTLSPAPTTSTELLEIGALATQDLFGAVRFFREDANGPNTYGIDGDIILVAGESAGAVMAVNAAVLDPDDTFTDNRLSDFFAGNGSIFAINGGVYGDVGGRSSVDSSVQGALGISGAVFDLSNIDTNSAPVFLAHEEFDSIVPCQTDEEGSTLTGLVVSGSCAIGPAYDAIGIPRQSFIVAGSVGHLDYTPEQADEFLDAAAQFFLDEVIGPDN